MSQFDDRLNQIMKGLLLDSSHDKDKKDDKKKDDKDKKDKTDESPKENQFPWDRGGINEAGSAVDQGSHGPRGDKDPDYKAKVASSKKLAGPKRQCPEGEFWCSVDKKCKPE